MIERPRKLLSRLDRCALLAASTSSLVGTMTLASCAMERIDFDAYLNKSIGMRIAETEYDSMISPVGGRVLKTETASTRTYVYRPPKSECTWEVTIDNQTLQVLSWRYPTKQAELACHDLPASRGV